MPPRDQIRSQQRGLSPIVELQRAYEDLLRQVSQLSQQVRRLEEKVG